MRVRWLADFVLSWLSVESGDLAIGTDADQKPTVRFIRTMPGGERTTLNRTQALCTPNRGNRLWPTMPATDFLDAKPRPS